MAYELPKQKVWKEDNSIHINNGRGTVVAAPENLAAKYFTLDNDVPEDDRVTLLVVGLPALGFTDVYPSLVCDEEGERIGVLADVQAYFESLGIGEASQGGVGTGADGKSAYEIAVDNGFVGTEQQWLASLVGEDGQPGANGLSAYQVAVQAGFSGNINQWLASLVGAKGDKGDPGDGANITVDATPTDGSNNPVSSNGVFDELALRPKQINLTRAQANAMLPGDFDPTINYAITTTI